MHRWNVDLSDSTRALFKQLEEELGCTSWAEVMRRALRLLEFYSKVRKNPGQCLAVVDEDGKILERVVVL